MHSDILTITSGKRISIAKSSFISFLEKGRFFRDWPNGRGVFINHDETVMVWVGEEDHIRCMSLEKGSDISGCYNKATRVSLD